MQITRASFVRSLFPEARCEIQYAPKGRDAGTIVLWQSLFDGPITLVSAEDTNVLLCLYDYDVDYRLLRINTSNSFTPPSAGSYVKNILFTCPWEIQEATPADWETLVSYLQTVSRSRFSKESVVVGTRLNESPESILNLLPHQGINTSAVLDAPKRPRVSP